MKLVERIKRECFMAPWIRRGYPRRVAGAFYRSVRRDLRAKNGVSRTDKEWAYSRKYLSNSIERYDLRNNPDKYIADLDFLYLRPFNNSFSKWLEDLVTENYVLSRYRRFLPGMRFSVITRENEKVFLPVDTVNRAYGETYEDFLRLVEEKKVLVLAPSRRWSKRSSYLIECVGEGAYRFAKDDLGVLRRLLYGGTYDRERVLNICGSQTVYGPETLFEIIRQLEYDWVVYEPYAPKEGFEGLVKLYVANRDPTHAEVLDAYVLSEKRGSLVYRRADSVSAINAEELSFIFEKTAEIASFVSEIEFLAVYVVPTQDGFVIDSFDTNPGLPSLAASDSLNAYLLDRFSEKWEANAGRKRGFWGVFWQGRFEKWVKRHCRPGMRSYMQKMWMRSVWDDFLHTKAQTISEKIWAWRRGFLSYRIPQYGLSEANYREILSDYQYHWLNRINNDYQVWVNDKITTRYVLEPCKQYLAKYYYEIIKRNGKPWIKALQDLPENLDSSFEGIFSLLEREGLLALKPSAGAHGDGFYRLEYDGENFLVNGRKQTKSQIKNTIENLESFYVVTEYLFNHSDLRDIYPHALNTIRVAVVNQSATSPRIMQAYMRIGSSSSGYTDNVGYGGICAHVRIEDGYCYGAETLKDHCYVPSPVHPDTGAKIERRIPHWDMVRAGVLELCSFMPQLEYLGFDIAVTDEGFKVLEINIHQDLHKAAEHSGEFRQFYQDKLRLKAEKYGLKDW